jgi:H+/Cl- antiporter ClcA
MERGTLLSCGVTGNHPQRVIPRHRGLESIAPMSTAQAPAPKQPPAAGLQGKAYLRLVGLGALIGIPAAFVAAAFLAFVHESQHWLWTDLPDALGTSKPGWYLVIFLPAIGACVVILARRLLPGDGGHKPLLGIAAAPTPLKSGPGVALAAIGTLTFGAVLGPEAPLIALGSAVGLVVTTFVRLGEKEQAVIATAGSFSAISALFGGPVVGGVLMTEAGLGMGSALIGALLPGFVAAALGYVIFIGLGTWGGLHEQAISVSGLPAYHGTNIPDLFLGVAVGIVAAIVIAVVRQIGTRVQDNGERRLGMAPLLICGGLAVGLLAQLADGLGANSQDVLFSGQSSIPQLLATDSTKIVLVLIAAKGVGYAISLGCGFRGGPVFPAIFLGVGLATLAVVWFGTSPTLALAVGTAAGMAAMTRLLLASILLATVLVGTPGLDATPAAVLAAAAAWLTITALDRRTPPPPAAVDATSGAAS